MELGFQLLLTIMYPDDRVLIVYVPSPADFTLIQEEGWYRIPVEKAPAGFSAEYYGFYFGRNFGPQKWAIHSFAAQMGHELCTRRELFPDQIDHPHVARQYYKVQLGPVQFLKKPILSLKWRRITFIHTTGDRFLAAKEVNDLLIKDVTLTNRQATTLREKGDEAGCD